VLSSDWIIETDRLTKEFKGFFAVREVSLKVRRGSIHALIGPNGAGKTTCFNLITRFMPSSSGKIFYDGQDITRRDPADVARLGLVRSFQISAVFLNMTVRDNIRVALQRKLGTSFHFWKPETSLDRLNERAAELACSVGIEDFLNEPAVALSYGRKRALEIATTLALDPMMLLLDEPMAGLGREDIERITELIRQVAVGRTILMVEHNLQVVASLSDTITVLARGEILAEGDYQTVSNHTDVIEAYMGTATIEAKHG
jgi:branched-chain amino acid transport system ATP-binding protein